MSVIDTVLQSPFLVAIFIVITSIIVITILLRSPQEKASYKPAGTQGVEVSEALSYADHVRLGNEAAGKYEFDKALAHFQEAIKLQGKEAEPGLHFKIGRLFVQKADYKNAVVAFRNVIHLNPEQIEAHYELARVFQLQGEAESAQKALSQALSINPAYEDALRLKVKIFAQEKQYLQALPFLKKLIEISVLPGKYRAQLAEFLIYLDRLDEALDEYETLLEQDPANQVLYKGKIGQIYFDKGDFTRAIEAFKAVLHEQDLVGAGETLASIRSQMAAALCNEGVKLFEAGDSTEAVQRYQEALLYDNANADIHYNLGKAYTQMHSPLNAIKHFEISISLNPMDTSCYYELAVLQDKQGMNKEALATYEKLLELDPQNLHAMFGLGTLHGVQGDLDQSIHYLTQAVRINPSYVDALYNLGVALERKRDFNKATQVYKRVLKLEKGHDKARSNLAHIQYLKAGR